MYFRYTVQSVKKEEEEEKCYEYQKKRLGVKVRYVEQGSGRPIRDMSRKTIKAYAGQPIMLPTSLSLKLLMEKSPSPSHLKKASNWQMERRPLKLSGICRPRLQRIRFRVTLNIKVTKQRSLLTKVPFTASTWMC